MIGKSNPVEVCGASGKAVEAAALCKQWKNRKVVFPPFASRGRPGVQEHRLENSPQKARVESSTVPTASATRFLLEKKPVRSAVIPLCQTAAESTAEGSGSSRIQAGRPENANRRRPRESFSLTSPFIERRAIQLCESPASNHTRLHTHFATF